MNRYFFLPACLLLCIGINAQAKGLAPAFFAKKIPIECRDREKYDISDCDSAMRLEFRKEEQDKLPDNQRRNFAQLGDSLLIEKATELRAGPYKIQVTGNKTPSTGFLVGTQKSAIMYEIGSFEGCNRGNAIKILKNTPEFTFFYWQCDDMRPSRRETQYFDYYNFDKRYRRLDRIAVAPNYNKTQPTLTINNGVYKFYWQNYTEKGFEPVSMYYDFKITGNRPVDLKCGRTWNNECDITMIVPLPLNQYKVLDE